MNSACFRFIADGRLKRKLRPMKKYPTFLQSKLFSFVLFFRGGGVKIQNKKSLLSTYKIFINSKCRLNKVRTNIVVDKKKKTQPDRISHCMASKLETDYTYCSKR